MQNNIPKIMVKLAQGTGQEIKLTLPLDSGKIKSLYAKNGWEPSKDFMVIPYSPSSANEDVNPIGHLIGLQKDVSFQKLNLFADKLASLDEEHSLQFESIARALYSSSLVDNQTITIDHLLEHVYSLDDFMVATNIGDDEELGEFLIENDFIEETDQPTDYGEIGRTHRIDTGGVFCEGTDRFLYYESPNGLRPDQLTVNVEDEWKKLLESSVPNKQEQYPPLYRGTLEDAILNGETKQYHQSYEQNRLCRDAILEKYSAGYDGYRVPKTIIPEAMEEFGKERVQWVLASTIQLSLHDGRIASETKSWANTIQNLDSREQMCGYMIDGHAGIVDIFAKQFQKIEKIEAQSKLHFPIHHLSFHSRENGTLNDSYVDGAEYADAIRNAITEFQAEHYPENDLMAAYEGHNSTDTRVYTKIGSATPTVDVLNSTLYGTLHLELDEPLTDSEMNRFQAQITKELAKWSTEFELAAIPMNDEEVLAVRFVNSDNFEFYTQAELLSQLEQENGSEIGFEMNM